MPIPGDVYAWMVVTAVICLLIYAYFTWTSNYWRKKGVPYLEPELFFGALKDNVFGKKSLAECYKDCYWKLDGQKCGGVFKFRQPVLLLRDPELVKTVIVKEFSSFQDNDFHSNVDVDPLFGRNPFVLRGDLWKEVRSKLTPGFTSGKLKLMYPLIQDVCKELLEHLREDRGEGVLREAKAITTKFAADSVAICAYGLQQNSFLNPDTEFRKYGRKFLEPTIWREIEQSLVILFPAVADFLKLKFTPTEVIDFFRRMTKEAVTYREKNNVKRNDFLQLLIHLKQKAEDLNNSKDKSIPWYKKFTDEDIAAQALTFFTDGYETSSTALAVLLYDLACNPDVQKRLREEVDSVIAQHNGQLDLDIVQEMEYLDMAVQESLRIHPPVPMISRLCTKPFELPLSNGKTFTVEVGTPVVTPMLAIHSDPEYFPDPTKFDPDRFTEENKAKRPKYVHIPFGEGPRICLGMRFGLAQNKICTVNILSEFEIRKCDKTPKILTPTPGAFIYNPKEEIWVKFVKRADK